MTSSANPKAATPPVHLVELAEVGTAGASAGPALLADKYELLAGVKVRLTATIGQATLTVGELFALKDGSLVPLDRLAGEPVDLALDGRVIARGRLVAVGEHFGISITEAPQGAAS